MKKYFSLVYWSLVTLVMSGILVSILNSFSYALLLSVMFLPGALFAKYFLKDLSFKDRLKGVLNSLYLALSTLFIEYLGIFLAYWYLEKSGPRDCPDIIINPIFIWVLLISFISLEKIIAMKLFTSEYEEKFIEFISERKRISIEIDSITYVESKDDEVWIRTTTGTSYRTKMKISQWEDVLDHRFIRVHRSFLLNRKHITGYNSSIVNIGEKSIEISRKYRDMVKEKLS